MVNERKRREEVTKSIRYMIILLCLLAFMLTTFFYSSLLEKVFALNPDLSEVSGGLEVHFVDVGQGDAILVRLPNQKTMIVDSGSSLSRTELLTYIDKVFFASNEHAYFDYAVLTHPDEDHAGNMLEVINSYQINCFYRPLVLCLGETSDENILVDESENYKAIIDTLTKLEEEGKTEVRNGVVDAFVEDAEYIQFLGPTKTVYTNSNAYSIVMNIKYNDESVLLCGDSEYDLLCTEVWGIDTSIIKVSHHGSKQSLLNIDNDEYPSDVSAYDNILDIVTPEYAVISVGEFNSYGHPNNYTLKVLQDYDVTADTTLYDNTFVTAEVGSVVFSISEDGEITSLTLGDVDKYCYIEWSIVANIIIFVIVVLLVFNAFKYYNMKKNEQPLDTLKLQR